MPPKPIAEEYPRLPGGDRDYGGQVDLHLPHPQAERLVSNSDLSGHLRRSTSS